MSPSAQPVPQYTVVRIAFDSKQTYDNPLWDVDLQVTFRSPSGRRCVVDGYWDGGRRFRAAFSPDEIGVWTWTSVCAPTDAGLNEQAGSFECVAYEGGNPLYRHGPLRVSEDGTHLTRADGTPCFWLADTAWNGVARGDDADWREYLEIRRRQGFTVIQFVATHWRGNPEDAFGQTACTMEHPSRVCPEWFQRIDRRVEMINEFGLVASPVMIWTLLKTDVGQVLEEDDCIRLGRYLAARYGALDVAWMVGGDGNYQSIGVDRWQRIGRGIFGDRWRRIATLHPCGVSWSNEEFRNEDWFDFAGYQSGHGDAEKDLIWHTRGPIVENRDRQPAMPVINLEPNYEGAYGYTHGTPFTSQHIRRASYWSVLLSPTAGVTYGHDAIWNWNHQLGPSAGHGDWHDRAVPPFRVGLETEGLCCMTLLREFFESLAWWTLRPAPDLLADQPGDDAVEKTVVAARTSDGAVRVIYTPVGGPIRLTDPSADKAQWFNPRNGEWTDAEVQDGVYHTPNAFDWLLVLE